MKTIKEWLEELPEPYKTQALTNMKNDVPYTGDDNGISLRESVSGAFIWDETPQGRSYWKDLHLVLLNSEFNKTNEKERDRISSKTKNNETNT